MKDKVSDEKSITKIIENIDYDVYEIRKITKDYKLELILQTPKKIRNDNYKMIKVINYSQKIKKKYLKEYTFF